MNKSDLGFTSKPFYLKLTTVNKDDVESDINEAPMVYVPASYPPSFSGAFLVGTTAIRIPFGFMSTKIQVNSYTGAEVEVSTTAEGGGDIVILGANEVLTNWPVRSSEIYLRAESGTDNRVKVIAL